MGFRISQLADGTGTAFAKTDKLELETTTPASQFKNLSNLLALIKANVSIKQTAYLTGAANHTPDANCVAMMTELVGGGGGGSGGGNAATAGSGGNGGDTTFGTMTGSKGTGGVQSGAFQAGGAASGGDVNIIGGGVAQGTPLGGGTPFGPGGPAALTAAGNSPAANTGAGGAPGWQVSSSSTNGRGGSGGGYCRKIYVGAAVVLTAYSVGAAGTAGTAGTSGFAGAAGAAGQIIVWELIVTP